MSNTFERELILTKVELMSFFIHNIEKYAEISVEYNNYVLTTNCDGIHVAVYDDDEDEDDEEEDAKTLRHIRKSIAASELDKEDLIVQYEKRTDSADISSFIGMPVDMDKLNNPLYKDALLSAKLFTKLMGRIPDEKVLFIKDFAITHDFIFMTNKDVNGINLTDDAHLYWESAVKRTMTRIPIDGINDILEQLKARNAVFSTHGSLLSAEDFADAVLLLKKEREN
jgi:hypothetical protein